MPTYDYFCEACGHHEEVVQKITAESLKTCPQCSQDSFLRRPSRGIGLVFKGAGFYATDYAPKQSSATSIPQDQGGGCCPCGKNKPCSPE
jgi:putative FmdB family regulatory protein